MPGWANWKSRRPFKSDICGFEPRTRCLCFQIFVATILGPLVEAGSDCTFT